jgi:hypothetical protein
MATVKSPHMSKAAYIEVLTLIQWLKDNGVIAGTDTVSTILTNLATERDKH